MVFIDAEAAECLHWSGGVNLLKRTALFRWKILIASHNPKRNTPEIHNIPTNGIIKIWKYAHFREFSIFESAPADYKKAVFVISSPIAGPVEETLKAIISASSFHYCVVITTCHPAVTRWPCLVLECDEICSWSLRKLILSFANNPMKDWNLEDQSSIHR